MINPKYYELKKKQEKYLTRENHVNPDFYNGIYERFTNPVLTAASVPVEWRYDLNEETNPLFEERLGVNSAFNSGAIILNNQVCLAVRIEGADRKSFFAIARSDSGIDGFRFDPKPILFDDLYPEETDVYDMRLTKHEDGFIYGCFCSESHDERSHDISSAVACAGLARTKNLIHWERLPNLKTLSSPQQRNVVLHPEFVNGKYAFYTRPMDGFIEAGEGQGIGFGLADDITKAVIDEEKIIDPRIYHTIAESKNGAGATPIKTPKGWLHFAHGVRGTAAGLRYVIYAFMTSLEDPTKVIAKPGGYLLAPFGDEGFGDVSNVVFSNGAVKKSDGTILLYYGGSDTRLYVARTSEEKMIDYLFHTPKDALRSHDCVAERIDLIDLNNSILH